MKLQPIHQFIMTTKEPELKEYLEVIRNKIDGLNTKIDKTSIWILLAAFAYFLLRNSLASNINLGIVELNKAEIGIIAIPPISAYLVLHWYLLSVYQKKSIKTSKVLSTFLLEGELTPLDSGQVGEVVRLSLPFSFLEEIYVGIGDNKLAGWVSILMFFPAFLSILILPFWLEWYMIKTLWIEYWKQGFIVLVSIITTTWLGVATIGFILIRFTSFLRTFKAQAQEAREPGKNQTVNNQQVKPNPCLEQ